MISLPDDWDEDLCVEERIPVTWDVAAHRGVPLGAQMRPEFGSELPRGKKSKATELLWRASEVAQRQSVAAEAPVVKALSFEPTRIETVDVSSSRGIAIEGETMRVDSDDVEMVDKPPMRGVFGDVDLPVASDPDVRAWTSKAPMFHQGYSFRASMQRGLLAVPVVSPGSGGTFRVKLLQISPDLLSQSAGDHQACQESCETAASSGVGLLEGQLQVGFAVPSTTPSAQPEPDSSIPRPLIPQTSMARALLQHHIKNSTGCFGPHMKEAFELIAACFGDEAPQGGDGTALPAEWPPSNPQDMRKVIRRLSAWLSRVNGRKVSRHLASASSSTGGNGSASLSRLVDMGSTEGSDAVGPRLNAVYHHLTANSVRGALQELNAAAGRAEDGNRQYFDRLATIIASCGGTSTPCKERRQWLRQQIMDWRSQGVNDLMGPALWRIYSLLAGELESVLGETLDWRTAFGMFVWYRSPSENSDSGGRDELLEAVREFERVVQKHGMNCRFRPVPSYALASRAAAHRSSLRRAPEKEVIRSDFKPEPNDLQFNIIRTVVGVLDWRDLSHFDSFTHTARPLDVAGSWHISVLILALCGGETSNPGFQLLSQQYCFLLELTGHWDWAIYIALFITDAYARANAIRGLLQRNATLLANGDAPMKVHWKGVPENWIQRALAMRSESDRNWVAAAEHWLNCGVAERALKLVIGFLQGPALLGHATAPFQRGSTEAIRLVPMMPPARWLLSILEKLQPSMKNFEEVWAEVGKSALALMQEWSASPSGQQHEHAALVQLYWRCNVLRRHIMGIPW